MVHSGRYMVLDLVTLLFLFLTAVYLVAFSSPSETPVFSPLDLHPIFSFQPHDHCFSTCSFCKFRRRDLVFPTRVPYLLLSRISMKTLSSMLSIAC